MSDILIKNYIGDIQDHLKSALALSQQLQSRVQEVEGDSDLYRKLAYYLTPSLNHWIEGLQAGNIKDLNELLDRREKEK
jgi:hypothetical protein